MLVGKKLTMALVLAAGSVTAAGTAVIFAQQAAKAPRTLVRAGHVVDVKTVQQNGKIITYHYKISEKFTTVPNDARIFEDLSSPVLTLSTCWPLGTNLRRLIVKADLVQ